MGNAIDLKSQPVNLEDDELIENLARFADGTLSEAAVKARHHLSNQEWAAMGESDRLVELVEAAKLRRIRSGITKRERAQIEIVDGPPILGKIMRDPGSNARHVIDAVKTLDGLASNGAEAAATGARFVIRIDLGSDTNGNPIIETYDKSIAPDPNDIEPNYPDDIAPPVRRPITDNRWDDDDGVTREDQLSATQRAALESFRRFEE
jgi:hypothetical protein